MFSTLTCVYLCAFYGSGSSSFYEPALRHVAVGEPLTCVATVATSLKTEFSTSVSLGCRADSSELWVVSGRMRLQASNKASAGSVPLFRLTRSIVVFGSILTELASMTRAVGFYKSSF